MTREIAKQLREEVEQFLVNNNIEYNPKTSTKNLYIKAQKEGFETELEIDEDIPQKPAKQEKTEVVEEPKEKTSKKDVEEPKETLEIEEPDTEEVFDEPKTPSKNDNTIWYVLLGFLLLYIVSMILKAKSHE